MYKIRKPYGIQIFLMIIIGLPLYIITLWQTYIHFKHYSNFFDIFPVIAPFLPILPIGFYAVLQNRLLDIKKDKLNIWKTKKKQETKLNKNEVEKIVIRYSVTPGEFSGRYFVNRAFGSGSLKTVKTPVYIPLNFILLNGEKLKFKIGEESVLNFRREIKEKGYSLEEYLKKEIYQENIHSNNL